MISNKRVQSGSGFVVRISYVHQIEYINNDKIVIIEIGGGINSAGDIDYVIYSHTMMRWLPPHHWEVISK